MDIKDVEEHADMSELVVGEMVEGPYGWWEYCKAHADQLLQVYPERHHRTVTVYECRVSFRPYVCRLCRESLWEEA